MLFNFRIRGVSIRFLLLSWTRWTFLHTCGYKICMLIFPCMRHPRVLLHTKHFFIFQFFFWGLCLIVSICILRHVGWSVGTATTEKPQHGPWWWSLAGNCSVNIILVHPWSIHLCAPESFMSSIWSSTVHYLGLICTLWQSYFIFFSLPHNYP